MRWLVLIILNLREQQARCIPFPSVCRLLQLKLSCRERMVFLPGLRRSGLDFIRNQCRGRGGMTRDSTLSRHGQGNWSDSSQTSAANIVKPSNSRLMQSWRLCLCADTWTPWRDQSWTLYEYVCVCVWNIYICRWIIDVISWMVLVQASEETVLPGDKKWPFLLRFPITSFGICLGVSSQAIMWKNLTASFLHVTPDINLALWFISVALTLIAAFIYALKLIFYLEAVRREYYHPVRVNFFFAPWITLLFLALGVPPSVSTTLHSSLWYTLMAPILCLELKIYGQWMSGGQRRLSKVANPCNHLSVVGNFVGALLGASMGLTEGPLFFFAVGLAHYIVLFVTLYQRLPTNETLPKELHPVFFLFVAAPSVASMAWARLQGSFDYASRIAYFIALFLYASLVGRQSWLNW